jgi:hypothetical protein
VVSGPSEREQLSLDSLSENGLGGWAGNGLSADALEITMSLLDRIHMGQANPRAENFASERLISTSASNPLPKARALDAPKQSVEGGLMGKS